MNPIEGLMYGFGVALTPENFLAALFGALLGTAVGILPGMGPTVVMAILLVPTMNMKVETGLIMLGAIYYGTQYGDSMTAILMNVPSEAPSVVIGIDGYQIAKKGRAGAALAIAAVGSFIGATVGLVGLTLIAGPVSQAALAFGPPEYFAITVVGLFVLSKISSASLSKGLVALGIGLALTTVGIEPLSGMPRYTFGNTNLMLGVDLVPVVMGVIGMAEMIDIASRNSGLPKAVGINYKDLMPTREEWKKAIPASFRGSFLGFFMGLLPGPTMALSTFASYRLEKRLAPGEVGHGAVQAVAGPKSADDGSISGTLVPLMALGIPFTAVTAVLFAGLLLHGVTPGPTLITERPEIFWGMVAAMYIGNVALLVLNFPLVGMWTSILRIPQPILSAMLVVLMMIGTYSLRNSTLDEMVLVLAGVLGYIMKQMNYERTLLILGMVLGPMLEANFGRSLEMSDGDLGIFVTRPIPDTLWVILVLVLIGPLILKAINGRRAGAAGADAN
ncbi:MAG: tripartite tricarboxylate transporter permease [Chloroflexi bacterium]|nr:tripartite tricarboxylate transporter permease [Chloroflexota bacterium]